jgi:hypothetical protein
MRLRGYFTPIVQYARTLRAISPVGTLPVHTVPLSIFLHFIFLLRNLSEIRPSECRRGVSPNQCLFCQFDSASPSCSPGYRAE